MRLNFLRKETEQYQKKTALKAILFAATLLCAGLFTCGTAYADNIEINDTSGSTWADAGTTIDLANGDTLTINATSSPSSSTRINVNGASATIIQTNPSVTIENIYIVASAGGATLNIEDLNMEAPANIYGVNFQGAGANTLNVEGVVSVTGTGNGRHAVYSAV